MKKYNHSFWLFFIIMAGITGIIILINNYSPVSVKELTEETSAHIKVLEENLEGIQEKFGQYGRVIDRFVEKSNDVSLLEEEIEAMLSELLMDNELVLGVSYRITPDHLGGTVEKYMEEYMEEIHFREVPLEQIVLFPEEMGRIKEEIIQEGWIRVSHSGEECFLYIRPVLLQEQPIGYTGMLLSTARIREQIEREQGEMEEAPSMEEVHSMEGEYFLFVDEAEMEEVLSTEKFIANEDWGQADGEHTYTYKVLGTGMVYVEVHKGAEQIRYGNRMILLVCAFAIAAMWIIQRKNRNGKSIFDQISDFIMKNYINDLNSTQRQGYRATIALNIGMSTAIFADVVYSITLGRGIKTLAEYLLFLTMSCVVLLLYKFSRTGITKKMAMGIIAAGLIGPLTEHILSGGFAMGRTGDSFLWFIVCLYIALFILGSEKAVHVLSAIVVLLFFDVVIEIVLFQKTNYAGSYLFAIGFILLIFALYNAMEVYVSGAAGHYSQTKKLIEELKMNQNLLLRKEKLGALGQLISGVAHEINTPIGAIKASAETMDSLFMTTLEEILDAAGAYDDEEYDAFLELVSMTLEAKGEMKSTLEVRMAKKEVKKYFEEIGLEKRDRILTLIGELEIVDSDRIRERLSLFQMENITDILERITKLTAFASGIPIILYASDRVSQIVLALKSYVHTSSISKNVELDLIKSIENVLILFRNQLKGDIKINRVYGNSPCVITGNPDELAQVWTNLIQNAIYAMKDGGELTIEIKELEDGNVEVLVGDTGAGIAPELLDQIYDPFFTTRQRGEGSGLGLNIAKKIIEKHNGVLEVTSQVGKGTAFHIRFSRISSWTE